MLYLLEKLKVLELNNKLPYPCLIANYKDKPYLIDGVKRTNNKTLNSDLLMNSNLDQLKLWLEINLKHRNILDAEYIILINSIENFNWNIYLNEKLIKEYLKCKNFNTSILKYLAKNLVSKNLIKYLYTVNSEILNAASSLLNNFEINPSNLKNILEYSNDIFTKTNKNILTNNNFIQLLKQSGLNTALNFLYEERFYNLNKKRKELKSITTKFKTLKIDFDNIFEDNILNFSFKVKNAADLSKVKQELNNDLIFDIINKYNE